MTEERASHSGAEHRLQLLIFASVLLSEYFLDRSSVMRLILTCPVYVIALVVISSRINALYEIYNASAHHSLANNKYLKS